jgi:hypothetical protein
MASSLLTRLHRPAASFVSRPLSPRRLSSACCVVPAQPPRLYPSVHAAYSFRGKIDKSDFYPHASSIANDRSLPASPPGPHTKGVEITNLQSPINGCSIVPRLNFLMIDLKSAIKNQNPQTPYSFFFRYEERMSPNTNHPCEASIPGKSAGKTWIRSTGISGAVEPSQG